MSNILIFISYFFFSCAGMVLIKIGAKTSAGLIFNLPIFNFNFSILSIFGFACYALSFFLYAVLLSRYELSFLNPTTIGISSVLIFISAVIFFGEIITAPKIIGLVLIIIGVLVVNLLK